MAVSVKLGFVPTYRFQWTPWTKKMRDDSLAAFAKLHGVEIVLPQTAADGENLDPEQGATPYGAVKSLDQGEVVAEYFARQKVDGLILCPLDFGDERSTCKIAEKLRVPVLLYATKEPPALNDAGMSRVSDSYCGNLSIASGLYRRRIPFHYAGIFFPDEADFLAEVDTFARAVAVVKGLKNARLGQVGVRPSAFETVGYDEAAMAKKFGQNVIYANLEDILDKVRQYADDDPQVRNVIADVKSQVGKVTVADDYLIKSAKLELALTDFWQSSRLSAMAMQCWPTIGRLMGISLCALFGRLTQQRMFTACEADVLGALAMLISYQSAMGETIPHFIDWTIQHREDPNRLLAWHCGNAPACLARDPQEAALRARRNMSGELPVTAGDSSSGVYQFQLKPGRVTFCRLAEYDGEWKMLIATGDIVPSDETLAGTWSWVAVRDHAHLYRTLVEEGFIHHASMIHGDQAQALIEACKFLDIKPIVVQ